MLKVLFHSSKTIALELDKEWRENENNSCHRWARLEAELRSANKETLIDEIKLQFSYPRLDVNVTRGVNHLLKSPLCIHPKTGRDSCWQVNLVNYKLWYSNVGRVCVPIDITCVEEFDPFTVPTISQICHEFETCTDEGRKGMNGTTPTLYYYGTCKYYHLPRIRTNIPQAVHEDIQ